MARDDRQVNVGIRTLVTDTNRKARVLGNDDLDEIAGMYSQKELDRMVDSGVLSGTWKSAKSAATTAKTTEETGSGGGGDLPDDFPLASVFAKLGFKSVEEIQSKSKEELVALDGIGEATARKALSYGDSSPSIN